MRLLALCADAGIPLDSTKGATIHLLELWRALAREGIDVTGVAPVRGGPARLPGGPGLAIHAVPDRERDAGLLGIRIENRALEAAAAVRPDAVLERLSRASDLGARIARRLGVPLAIEVNAPLDDEARRYRGDEPDDRATAAQRRTLEAADLVYCVSDALVPYAFAHGARPGRVRVLPNGVDTDAFRPPPADRDADRTGPVRFGFVGSFKAWHGCDLLLEATLIARDRHADLELLLVGEGPQRPVLEEVAGRLGLAAYVRFLGARDHQEIPAFLHGLDVAVAPAPAGIDYYFSPLKVWEYAAAGCAIIAPRAGQVAERLRHAEDAWLVEPGSPAELAAAMMELAGNPELRRRLGAAAGARAHAEFSWSRVARRLLVWLDDAGVADAARSVFPAPPATSRGSTP